MRMTRHDTLRYVTRQQHTNRNQDEVMRARQQKLKGNDEIFI